MSGATVRPASPEDCEALLNLIRELARFEKLEHEVFADATILRESLFGERPRAFALMAYDGGALAGFCIYFYNFSTFVGRSGLYIEDIYVREAHRGRGIGKRLFAELLAIAARERCGRVEWWVLDWNRDAIGFYEKMGAKPMADWTVYRLTEDKFTAPARKTA